MSEIVRASDIAVRLATEVLEGFRPEDERSPLAVRNFIHTVRIIYGDEAGVVQDNLQRGRITIVTPQLERGTTLAIVSEGIHIYRRLIALLNPAIWTDQSLFDARLVRKEALTRVYPATRRTIYSLFKI